MMPTWLSQLAPDHAPPPPGWWPPAPGWWGLALLLLLGAALGAWLRWRRRRPSAARYRRLALRALASLQGAGNDDASVAHELQQLLRRYAVVRYGRAAVAGLAGDAWIAFVVSHGGSDWSGATGRDLLRCAYGGAASAGRERWITGARAFLRS